MRKYNLPYHVIADSFGRNAMYWYRLELSLSYNNIVGTTVKDPTKLPSHLLMDEHHSKLLGQKVYVCTTVAAECFLGAEVAANITFEALQKAYGIFKKEVQLVCPYYRPTTVNIDGFRSTRQAISSLFPNTALVLCFLHGYLKIENNASKRYSEYFDHISNKVWSCYQAKDKRGFAQQIRRLEEWTEDHVPQSNFKNAILKLCQKKMSISNIMIIPKAKELQICWTD